MVRCAVTPYLLKKELLHNYLHLFNIWLAFSKEVVTHDHPICLEEYPATPVSPICSKWWPHSHLAPYVVDRHMLPLWQFFLKKKKKERKKGGQFCNLHARRREVQTFFHLKKQSILKQVAKKKKLKKWDDI
jgi:hypothetical protein